MYSYKVKVLQKIQTILVVDDTDANIDILVELLSEYDVLVATDGQGAIEIANEEKVDLILLDVMMPIMDGFETCQILKSKQQTKDIPIIFITAKSDEDSIEYAYDIGGIDYVTKPFKPKELIARVKTHLQTKMLIENLEYISSHDSMTGLHNRRYFMEFADGIIKHSIRQKQPLSLLMIDIDKFKHINDTHGHNVGDIVIRHISDRLRSSVRESDVVARIGGEEFVILLPNTGEENAVFLAEKIRETVEAHKVELEKETIAATISVGVCELDADLKPGLETLLKDADEALYVAKNSGRNQVKSLKKGKS